MTEPLDLPVERTFASDNYAGVHPEVLAALAAANCGHARPYGEDPLTAAAIAALRRHLGDELEVALVPNGTGANVVGLQLLLRPWEHVIAAPGAHIQVDECGAVERILGSRIVPAQDVDGKLTPEAVRAAWTGVGNRHHTQPRAVSVSQPTELGTVYTPAELSAVVEQAHALGMSVHLDGARLANAAVELGLPLAAVSTDCGVDVLSFGGTKNGLCGAEAVVVRPEFAAPLQYVQKQSLQLLSKSRFLAAQLLALLDGDLWARSAGHANAMAERLRCAVAELPGVVVTRPRQANAVFARLPAGAAGPLQQRWPFYEWDPAGHEVRWMCSWDTTEADVDGFVADLRAVLAGVLTGG